MDLPTPVGHIVLFTSEMYRFTKQLFNSLINSTAPVVKLWQSTELTLWPQFRALCDHNSLTLQTYELGNFKGVGHFEAKFCVEGLRFAPISMDR